MNRFSNYLCGFTLFSATLFSATLFGAVVAAPGAGASGNGLVAAYSFDDATAPGHDLSGTGNDGVVRASWVAPGKSGGALSFDGSTSWVTIPDRPSLDLTTGMTLEAWVQPAGSLGTAWKAVAVKERPGGLGYALYANSNRGVPTAIGHVGGGERPAYGTSRLTTGRWTHLAATYDGTAVRLYVNGVMAATTPAPGSLTAANGPLRLGGDSVWGEHLRGLIDEVRVYNRALSTTEIKSDMSTPVGTPVVGDTTAPSAPGNLRATSATSSGISLSWSPSTDLVGVAGYGVYRDGAPVGSTAGTSTTVSGLACGTTYTLAVDAYDAAGNRSAKASVVGSASPCADVTPPSAPGGLVASSIGDTTVTLQWSPSSDNAGVAGYGLFVNGVQTGSSTTTSGTLSGLTCATSYTVGVDAVDTAGNRSARSALTITTAGCASGGGGSDASYYVAPSGSDASPCTSAQPCATFNRAVGLAAAGQVVEVAAGDYAAQSLSAAKAGPAPVVVRPASGARVTVAALDVVATYVEVRGLVVRNAGGWSVGQGARFVTLRDVHSPRGWIIGSDITVVGGEIGPVDSCASGTEDGLQIWQRGGVATSRVTIDGVYIHDVNDHDNSCAGFPNAGVHDDCVQILAGHYTTIRNSTFSNCPTSNVLARPYLDTLDHLTIENNVLNPERRAGASLSIGSTGDTCAAVVVQYNTMIGESSIFDCSTQMIVRGNIFPRVRGGLCGYGQAPQYSYNVWQTGPACAATDRVCTPAFVDAGVGNFHLAPSDACARGAGDPANYPRSDIDGDLRPLGGAPDAGADEIG